VAQDDSLISLIANSFANGEISPALYGRTDLAKVHQSAIFMRNFFVDYKGGASSAPGTQYIGVAGSAGKVRLIPFQFSAAVGQTYMLVFSALKLRFIKNSGGASYPNSSNAAFIESSPGVPYEVTTPYAEVDLPFLKYSQVADQLTITRHGYSRRVLSRITDTNWTLTVITNTMVAAPTISAITISPLPVGSTDPQKTRYSYVVTCVDTGGTESAASVPFVTAAGIDIGTTQGTVTVFFTPVANAAFYKIYKSLPTPGDKVPSMTEQYGYAGFSYGTVFADSNIIPDFTQSPPNPTNPFIASKIIGYTITASSADWPVGGTTITVTDGTGSGAFLIPTLSNNTAAGVGTITGIQIVNGGSLYSAPTLAAVGGGTTFTATATLSPATGFDPDVVSLFQQRQAYASTLNQPNTIFLSHPGHVNDFRTSNPVSDNDALEFTIASQQVNDIVWMQSMPGGLVIGTNSGIVQLTGGSANAANPLAVTPTSAVIVPQSYYGAADIDPIVIDYDILYVQSEGSLIRDLQYNFFVNIYTGVDITVLSSHLFYPRTIVSWAYQDTPYKVIWSVRDDGVLLCCTYLKAQEVIGWTHRDTIGIFEDVAVVREGSTDAVYLVVNRLGTRRIERLCDRIYDQVDDAWCFDSALSTVPTFPAATIIITNTGPTTVQVDSNVPIFNSGSVGKTLRASKGRATITSFINTQRVLGTIVYPFPVINLNIPANQWRLDANVSVVSGLTHLNGLAVYALVDGEVQGPFVPSAGSITLLSPGSQVVVGQPFMPQLQTTYLDVGGETTMQGKRKKVAAASVRVKDSQGVMIGTSFNTLKPWRTGLSNTDEAEVLPYNGSGLVTGDMRLWMDPSYNVIGQVCIEGTPGLPISVLAVIPEVAMGDK
jgi:hypothetical protein